MLTFALAFPCASTLLFLASGLLFLPKFRIFQFSHYALPDRILDIKNLNFLFSLSFCYHSPLFRFRTLLLPHYRSTSEWILTVDMIFLSSPKTHCKFPRRVSILSLSEINFYTHQRHVYSNKF